MHVWNVLQCTRLAGNTVRKKSPSGYRRNWGMYSQWEKKLLNSNISSTWPHNMVNFGPLTTEICWWVWGTPANSSRFRNLALLLHQRRSTLHDVWPSLGLVHTHSQWLLPPENFARCKIHFTSRSCVLLYWQRYCKVLQQASAKLFGVVHGME